MTAWYPEHGLARDETSRRTTGLRRGGCRADEWCCGGGGGVVGKGGRSLDCR